MKQQLAIHGRDHRLGGADPVPFQTPYVLGHNSGVNQSVTADAELLFDTVQTNDRSTFRWDPDDPYGFVIIKSGLFRFSVTVYGGGAVEREVYAGCELLGSGALAGLGNAVGEASTGVFQLGHGNSNYSVSAVTTGSGDTKTALSYVGVAGKSATSAAPLRAAVLLEHNGTDFTVGGIQSSLLIERIGIYPGGLPPLPPS